MNSIKSHITKFKALNPNITTVDNARLRVTVLAVTAYRCKTSQKKAIRAITRERLEVFAKEDEK